MSPKSDPLPVNDGLCKTAPTTGHLAGPLPHIAEMAFYALADMSAPVGVRRVSMAQNESLRPPSPRAVTAARHAANGMQLYPDADWTQLRKAISEIHGIDESLILCGAGSMELIACLAHAYLGPGRSVLTTRYGYAFVRTVAGFTNSELISVDEKDYAVSCKAILAGLKENTAIVFVANPGNPTGTQIPANDILELRRSLPGEVMLVVDEAYGEFCDGAGTALFDLSASSNTVILRTFSKAYGLAGMRVGWGLFPPGIATEVCKLLNPNNIAVCSQAAARAAMLDQDYLRETCRLTAEIREYSIQRLMAAGFGPPRSSANFVLIPFANAELAARADDALRAKGFLMRGMGGYGLSHCLRATIVEEKDMMDAMKILEGIGPGQ